MAVQVVDSRGITRAIHPYKNEVYRLSEQEKGELASVASEIASRYIDNNTQESHRVLDDVKLMLECENIFRRKAPEKLVQKVLEFRKIGNMSGVFVLQNLPGDAQLPSTPNDGNYNEALSLIRISTIVQLMVTTSLGDVISYADEKEGRIIQDIVPVVGSEELQENSGSCLLEFHTENGFHPSRPRFVTLLGLRGNPDAYTLSSGIHDAISKLDWETIGTLSRPGFKIKYSSSFVSEGYEQYSDPLPVLGGSMRDPELCVDFNATVPLDAKSKHALSLLESALLDGIHGAALDQGDLIIIDNDKAVHGRTSFVPTGNEKNERWLRRCFAVADLRASSAHRLPLSHVHREITKVAI